MKQLAPTCECGDCAQVATMRVQIKPARTMVLCDYHTGEMIAWVVLKQRDDEPPQSVAQEETES